MGLFMMLATNIIALALISVVMIQGQTSAGLGSVFGGSDIYRTRRVAWKRPCSILRSFWPDCSSCSL